MINKEENDIKSVEWHNSHTVATYLIATLLMAWPQSHRLVQIIRLASGVHALPCPFVTNLMLVITISTFKQTMSTQ
jgi:hypothetical protein